jgi:GlpG protein
MRQIGELDSLDLAQRFQDYLISRRIACSIDDQSTAPSVWVHDDDQVAAARTALAAFRAQPDAPEFADARQQASQVLKEQAAFRKAARNNRISLNQRWQATANEGAPITIVVLLAAVVVWAMIDPLRDPQGLLPTLTFSTDRTWDSVTQDGELWRIFSPVLLHFGPLHLICNALTIWSLGQLVESRMGAPRYALFLLLLAAVPNALQFAFTGPNFGGLSGVGLGLFGYLWMKGRYDPLEPIQLSAQSIQWMLIFYAACVFGVVGNIANWCHTGGLVLGMAVGLIAAAAARR